MKVIIPNGFFITFEGPEGAGKTTQTRLLQRALENKNYDVRVTREPGGTPLGEELRRLLKCSGEAEPVCPEAELLLFGASRAQHMTRVIRPHLEAGGVVICDRFADSTSAYQGSARKLDPEFIAAMHRFTLADRWPDLTLLLDIAVEKGFERVSRRNASGDSGDRIEGEPTAFHEKVRQGFRGLARNDPGRFRIIPADRPPERVHAHILEIVNRALA